MSTNVLRNILKFVVLLLVQLILLNHIHILGYISPIVIAYMTMNFRRGCSRISLLLWGFAIGLVYDVFSNTMGIGMASCTLLGMIQPILLKLFTPRDAADDLEPSMRTLGARRYTLYALFSMLIFHTVFYLLDALTLSNLMLTACAIGIGTASAFLLIIIAQSFRKHTER